MKFFNDEQIGGHVTIVWHNLVKARLNLPNHYSSYDVALLYLLRAGYENKSGYVWLSSFFNISAKSPHKFITDLSMDILAYLP